MMGEGAWICIDMASVGGARGRPRGSWVSSGGRSQAGDGGTLKLQEVGEHCGEPMQYRKMGTGGRRS